MSEDPSETSFSLLSASVVTAADTSGAVHRAYSGEKMETGLSVTTWDLYKTEGDRWKATQRENSH